MQLPSLPKRRVSIAYVAFGTALFVAMLGHTANEKWASPDFWLHLGAVREFAEHPLHPGNSLVVGGDADPYLSPYTWFLGVVSRVTGVNAVRILAVAGIINLLLLLVALYRLVTTFSNRRLAPPVMLLLTLFAWGLSPWRWSGFFNFNSIGTVLPLASTFAGALALFALSSAVRWLRTGVRSQLLVTLAAVPLVITCHPFTATWTAALGVGFVVGEVERGTIDRALKLFISIVGAAVVALCWPYYSVVELPGASTTFESSNSAMFARVLQRTFLALLGLVPIAMRLRARRRDPVALGFLATSAVFAIGWMLDRSTLGRVLPAAVLMLHLALADLIAGILEEPVARRVRVGVTTALSVGCLIGLIGVASGIVRSVPRVVLPGSLSDRPELRSLVQEYRPIGQRISRDEVLVASRSLAIGAAAIGGKAISPPAPAPFVAKVEERRRATDKILDPMTGAAERGDELVRYQVDWLVLTPEVAARFRDRGVFDGGQLNPQVTTSLFVLVRVSLPAHRTDG